MCIIRTDDGDGGWETVQRGKPNRSRPSSAKKSISARSSRSSLPKTTTSSSSPSQSAAGKLKDQHNNNNIPKQAPAARGISGGTGSNGRERTDSEKENQPIVGNRNALESVLQEKIEKIENMFESGNSEELLKAAVSKIEAVKLENSGTAAACKSEASQISEREDPKLALLKTDSSSNADATAISDSAKSDIKDDDPSIIKVAKGMLYNKSECWRT